MHVDAYTHKRLRVDTCVTLNLSLTCTTHQKMKHSILLFILSDPKVEVKVQLSLTT